LDVGGGEARKDELGDPLTCGRSRAVPSLDCERIDRLEVDTGRPFLER
jgi:hypothetical protein